MLEKLPHLYKLGLLFIPYFISGFVANPITLFFTSWVGSIYIILLSWSGFIIPLPKDLPRDEQFFRPLYLTQLLFAGYGFLTSIFFFADKMGYVFLDFTANMAYPESELAFYADCQKLYLLGHACYTTGLLLFYRYDHSKYEVKVESKAKFMVSLAFGLFLFAIIGYFIPGLNQLSVKFRVLGYVISIFSLSAALEEKDKPMLRLSQVILLVNLVLAFISGSKEDSITILILLSIMLYPFYKKTVLILAPILLYLWLSFVPILTNIFRSYNWYGGNDVITSYQLATDQISELSSEEFDNTSWKFFVDRFSEIGMFEVFVSNIPTLRPYYEWEIVNNAMISLIPRFFWPDKPLTEFIAMERIYDLGIVEEGSGTSAKSHYFADSYMSFGAVGIIFFLFLLGSLVAITSFYSEKWFGGYYWGSMIMFTGLFKIFWTGNSFEFIFNAILWSFIILYFFHIVGRMFNVIVKR